LEPYDVIVVGSGAGGGMSAYVLAHAGLKVLMLEAGRDYDPAAETPMFNLPSQAPLRGVPTPDKPRGFYDATVDGGWGVPNEPYTVAEGSDFRWWRARMLGGRTNHWSRVTLRFGPYDFKPYSRDGLGSDWPITYDDLAPWYDRVERLIGVTGLTEGLENSPDSPPGILLPPPPPRPTEYFIKRGFERMGIPVAAIRAAILTQPFNGRPACYFATPCTRGCATGANFQTPTVLIPPALATGNLEIRTNALVYRVDLDDRGRAAGVSFVNRRTGDHHSLHARSVVLAASACETARILLNSKSTLFSDGLANENGLVGRYLMETPGTTAFAQFPALEHLPPRNDDGISLCHIYVPWWGHAEQASKKLDFPRGYHIQMKSGRNMPNVHSDLNGQFCTTPYGIALRDEVRRKFGSYCVFAGFGEMIPNENSFCEIDPTVTDKWGIPVLRFHWQWSDHEIRQVTHMRKTFAEVIARLGGTMLEVADTDGGKAIQPAGTNFHEVGGVRMGSSPRDSVVNGFGQSWSVKNLFIADGSVFVSSPHKNPTLSILALSWRNSAYLAEQARKGNL
jgi:choline dehydrogenase-like flavoprotein